MKTAFATFFFLTLLAAPAFAEPSMDDCRAMNAKYEADHPGTTTPSPAVRDCINAVLNAQEQRALAERARLDAEIRKTDNNAAKLPGN